MHHGEHFDHLEFITAAIPHEVRKDSERGSSGVAAKNTERVRRLPDGSHGSCEVIDEPVDLLGRMLRNTNPARAGHRVLLRSGTGRYSSPQPTAQRRLDLFPRLAGQGFGVGLSQSLIDQRSFGRRHGEVIGVDRRPELIDQLNPLGDSELLRPGEENLIDRGHIILAGADNGLRRKDARHGNTKPHPANGMGLVSCPAAGESSG